MFSHPHPRLKIDDAAWKRFCGHGTIGEKKRTLVEPTTELLHSCRNTNDIRAKPYLLYYHYDDEEGILSLKSLLALTLFIVSVNRAPVYTGSLPQVCFLLLPSIYACVTIRTAV